MVHNDLHLHPGHHRLDLVDELTGEFYAHFDDGNDKIYLITEEENQEAREKKNQTAANKSYYK